MQEMTEMTVVMDPITRWRLNEATQEDGVDTEGWFGMDEEEEDDEDDFDVLAEIPVNNLPKPTAVRVLMADTDQTTRRN